MDKVPSRVLEVTVISGEDIRVNKKQPARKNVSVTVRSDPLDPRSTGVNTEGAGGGKLIWNQKLTTNLPMHAGFITVEVHSGNKIIGSARIPVSDFSGGYVPENYLSFLSYRLRDGKGEKNGIVNLSVKVIGKLPEMENRSCPASWSRPWFGGPVNHKAYNGVVTGIPVSYRF